MAKKKAAKHAPAKNPAKRSASTASPTPIDSIRHSDTRKNIPTEELRDFVSEEELAPQTMLYARDPSLDPQLVWKGKDDQDRQDLSVPVVPIYIQEKIHPEAIIEDVLKYSQKTTDNGQLTTDHQLDLFADFNGLPEEFDQRIDFYQHDGHWSNRMILGDSLLVMTSLAEKEGLRGHVQTIYLDPPYGIKFGSNWQVSTRKRDVKDGKAEDATRQPEQVRAFRDTWKLGIHSYLAYLRDRLVAARELLTETGSVFVQIGDENVHLMRCVLDEVFGSSNFVGCITFVKASSQSTTAIPSVFDYLLVYAKDAEIQKLRPILQLKQPGARGAKQYTNLISPDFQEIRPMTSGEISGVDAIPTAWEICRLGPTTSQGFQQNRSSSYDFRGEKIPIPKSSHWKYDPAPGGDMDRLAQIGRLRRSGSKAVATVLLSKDNPTTPLDNIWLDTGTGSFTEDQVYVVQTGNKVIQRCLLMTTDPGDLVLDPTCGSGTTAYVAEQWGRRWITCDTSRVALALARTRLMAAKYPYYHLAADYPTLSPTATDDEIKSTLRSSSLPSPSGRGAGGEGEVKKGFVYKRVPHVTLKSIANNPDIREGMSRSEIDAAIARHADTETLFDQPYEDKKRLRVSGPFTVESLSPHRTISIQEKKRLAEVGTATGWKVRVHGPSDFATMIIDNLRKAGVQNTVKGERLKFDSLNPYAGEWIHAEGHYTEQASEPPASAGGVPRRAAICIGPEHGTVGAQLIKEAAKEAVRGVGFDLLIVCGFAFDPSVSEEAKRYGKLTVLPARMNPDLAMGDELLKKTGAGNLFMVFGEPDIEVKASEPPASAGGGAARQLTVEIRGLDVYDPTTGEIRNSSTDDVACWFIDTAYNGESFFVRHAYFTGAANEKDGGPYDKLKRALKAEIDEAAWSSLYSTTSRPFDRPATGKIAVKVINHYGDEVLKVYDV